MSARFGSTALLVLLLAGPSVGALEAQEARNPNARGPESGPSFVTVKGYGACVDRGKFHELMAAVAQEVEEKYTDMLKDTTGGCFMLREGVNVELVTNAVTFVEVRPEGMRGTIWTVPEALRRREGGGEEGSS